MNFNHPIINNERTRKPINIFYNALYVKRNNIKIINDNNISINRNIIEGVDKYDSFMNHLNTNGSVVITIDEGKDEKGHINSYTNVQCDYVPSDDDNLYFNVINMIKYKNKNT